jgi:hypothetical protein
VLKDVIEDVANAEREGRPTGAVAAGKIDEARQSERFPG